ncbi:transcription factor HES-1-B-like [Lethenteron reissneri]|uniref:transcription factor HES-1-B-like n=1 Tax=Lethenteron reissneri TaxID=7753 RepID=UPI002AB6F3A1|nr:transcription factor HES-1-B-like [Lethenteron reissneri]
MPVDTLDKNASSPVAASTACNAAAAPPDKPKSASEHRKSTKPVMEKRRRARINDSLNQLKALILEALKKDSSRHSKLEKADILEMTVKHLRSLQRLQMSAALCAADPGVLGRYRAGYSECVNEVTRFLSTSEGVHAAVRTRLLAHLADSMAGIPSGTGGGVSPSPLAASGNPPALSPLALHGAALPVSSSSSSTNTSVSSATNSSGGALSLSARLAAYGAAGVQVIHTAEGPFAFIMAKGAQCGAGFPQQPGPVMVPLFAGGVEGQQQQQHSPPSSPPVKPGSPPLLGSTSISPVVRGQARHGQPLQPVHRASAAVWRPW